MIPNLIIHGGAGRRAKNENATRSALQQIFETVQAYLKNHSALETVIYATTHLEDCPLFNAGTGSILQQDGKVRMSASVMDGRSGQFAAVMNIEDVKNPVQVASLLLEQEDRVLAGPFATEFARKKGFKAYNPVTNARLEEWQKKSGLPVFGTVGAVAVDLNGNLAAATSTGGRGYELPGRVSDSAMPAGNFASSQAAVSCTGIGEQIINEALASKIVTRVEDGMTLTQAFKKSFSELSNKKYQIGAIGIDRTGHMEVQFSTPAMNFFYRQR